MTAVRVFSRLKSYGRRSCLLIAVLAISCPSAAETRDPLESLNRQVQTFNGWIASVVAGARPDDSSDILRPLGEITNNVLVNLSEPLTFANAILQGRDCAAGVTLRRFLVNSTVGLGGLIDIAKSSGGLAHYDTDLSTTLGLWGVPPGPYLVLPLVGPSSARAVAGFAIEYAADPADYALARIAGQTSVIARGGLDAIRSASRGETLDGEIGSVGGDSYLQDQQIYLRAAAQALGTYECPGALHNAFWQR